MKLEYSPINGVRMLPTSPGVELEYWRTRNPYQTWYYNPWTGARRSDSDVLSDQYGQKILLAPERALGDYVARRMPVAAAMPGSVANAQPRVLQDDDKREQYPLYDGLMAYFPAALCEVARWSIVGNNKHNPGQQLHWAREKSTDHENKILRHLLDARQVDKDGFVEAVALAWRALALCQTILEERGWAEGQNARRVQS